MSVIENTKPVLTLPNLPSSQHWRLRPSLPTDALALCENCFPQLPPTRVKRLLRRAKRNALNRRGLGLVAEIGGDVVGFGQITLWSKAAEISDLVIGSHWRGLGIGSALIRRLIAVAKEMNAPLVEIGVALRDFHVLMLYRKLGFEYGRTLDLEMGRGPEPVMYLQINLPESAPLDLEQDTSLEQRAAAGSTR